MLQTLRDKTSGWFATVILGLLIVPFAFVGMQDYFRPSNDQAVATISAPPKWWPSAPAWMPFAWTEEEITANEFRTELDSRRQQARTDQGLKFDLREFESADNKRAILESLIDQRVQKLWADVNGIAASDAMVQKEIAGIPEFQTNGRFDLQKYRRSLAMFNPPRTEAQFEQAVRESLVQNTVRSAVGTSGFAAPGELSRVVAMLLERRDLTVLELPPIVPDTGPVTPAEMESWYRAQRNRYRAPETVTVEYVELNAASIPAPEVTDAILLQQYEKQKARFTAQEQRQAAHILVRVEGSASAAAQQAARAKAQQLATQARAPGADFAALARANSDDAGSKAAGGDLGLVARGDMPAEADKVLFSMQPGQVSDPVKTEFGWHVIQLRQVQQGRQQTFEQARESLAAEYVESERERRFNETSSKFVDTALENPSALVPAARAAGLPVQRVGPLARGQGSGVLANPAVQRVMFSESAIQDGMVTDPIEVGENHSVLLRVAAHAAARPLTLAEARARVIADIRADRSRKAAERRAAGILASVRGGQPLAQVATAQGLPAPQPILGLPRGTDVIGEGVADVLFSVPPKKGAVAAGSHVLPDGRAIVFVVDRVQPGTPAEIPPGQDQVMKKQLAELTSLVDVETTTRAMRRQMRIRVNEAGL